MAQHVEDECSSQLQYLACNKKPAGILDSRRDYRSCKQCAADDPHIKELLKMLSRIGSTMAGSDERKSYMLTQLKSSMVYYGCPILFLTINPVERYSPISLFYAGEKIDVKNFSTEFHTYSDRLKCMLNNPLPVVEYFHDLVMTIIEMVLKGGMFGELNHYYGTIEYQGRYTPHIHMAVLTPHPFFISVAHCFLAVD